MKRLRKYQIDGEFSNMKELKGVTKPLRDSYWYDQSKKNFPRHYKAEYALQNDPQRYPYAKNETYGWHSKYHSYDGYSNEPLDTGSSNFLQDVIDYTKIAYGPEYYDIKRDFGFRKGNGAFSTDPIWLGIPQRNDNFYNEYGEKNNDINFNNNEVLLHNINVNHNYLAQKKKENDYKDLDAANCWIDSDGLKYCGSSPYELGPLLRGANKDIDHKERFERVKKYMPDAARRTYQIATQDFTPYNFEGLVNQPKSYRMADESENTPIAYDPENLFVLPNKDVQEKPRINSIEDLYYKKVNQLPSQNVEVPDINRKSELLPESKPIREPRTIKLTPQEEIEFLKRNNIQPVQKNKTRKLTPEEEIEFKKKYNIK